MEYITRTYVCMYLCLCISISICIHVCMHVCVCLSECHALKIFNQLTGLTNFSLNIEMFQANTTWFEHQYVSGQHKLV